jgi:hypothetical protein
MNPRWSARGAARASADKPSIVYAEAAVLRLRVYPREFFVVHVNECGVVTTFHINTGLRVDAVVNNNIEAVALPDRRNSAARTIAEQLRDLLFTRQSDTVVYLRSQVLQVDTVGGRKHGEQVAAVTPQHNALGQAIAGDLADLGGARRRHCWLVLDHLVRDGLIQVSLQHRCDGHSDSSIAAGNRHTGRSARRRLTMRASAVITEYAYREPAAIWR